MPREEETRNQDINSKEKTAKQERIHKPEIEIITNDIQGYTPRKEGESIAMQEETCGWQTCGPLPCPSPCKAWKAWTVETCECTPSNQCTIKCRQWKTQGETINVNREEDKDKIPREETPNPENPTKPEEATTPPDTPVKADREEDTDNIPREETPNPETPIKPEGATTPPYTNLKAMDAISTIRSPEATKTLETMGNQEKTSPTTAPMHPYASTFGATTHPRLQQLPPAK